MILLEGLFQSDVKEAKPDVQDGLDYIARTPEINNVLLTGGDPLILNIRKLRNIIEALRAIDHVKIIRIGSKMPVFNPMRIYEDQEFLDLIRTYSTAEKRMAHVNHPSQALYESYTWC
jgi:lysine 2,3-aminomutase